MIAIVLMAGGVVLVIFGLGLSWAVFTQPYLLALGVNLTAGLLVLVGGLLLLALGLILRELKLLRGQRQQAIAPLQTTSPPSAPASAPAHVATAAGQSESSAGQRQPQAPNEATGAGEEAPEPVEERLVRGHPVRLLADGGVEAELSGGWFRFESMSHLHEYLDALEQLPKAGGIRPEKS